VITDCIDLYKEGQRLSDLVCILGHTCADNIRNRLSDTQICYRVIWNGRDTDSGESVYVVKIYFA
jgi:hypothetical protein